MILKTGCKDLFCPSHSAHGALVVAREVTPSEGLQPLGVTTSGIPNDHLQYAGTWFSLAAVWLGMTGYLLWRIRQRTT